MLTAIFIQMTCNIFQQRVNEAFSMYCDDEDREKPFVFNKEQVEGRRFFSARPREMPERRYLIGECILLFATTNRNLLIPSIIHPKCAVFLMTEVVDTIIYYNHYYCYFYYFYHDYYK